MNAERRTQNAAGLAHEMGRDAKVKAMYQYLGETLITPAVLGK